MRCLRRKGRMILIILGFIYVCVISKESKKRINQKPEFRINQQKCSKVLQLALDASLLDTFIPGTKIPAIIHQSWKTKHLDGIRLFSSKTWHEKLPELLYLLWDDKDIECFIETLHPELMDIFLILPAIMKADLFRYLVVYEFGGIYSDIDTAPLKDLRFWFRPLDTWRPSRHTHKRSRNTGSEFLNVSFVAGLEIDVPRPIGSISSWTYSLQLCQWTFAAAPKYSVVWNVINKIIETTRSKSQTELKNANVVDATGPNVWTREIYRSWREFGVDPNDLREFGDSPRIINDQLILPLTAFNPGQFWENIGTMGSKYFTHPNSLVIHYYMGSWKHL